MKGFPSRIGVEVLENGRAVEVAVKIRNGGETFARYVTPQRFGNDSPTTAVDEVGVYASELSISLFVMFVGHRRRCTNEVRFHSENEFLRIF